MPEKDSKAQVAGETEALEAKGNPQVGQPEQPKEPTVEELKAQLEAATGKLSETVAAEKKLRERVKAAEEAAKTATESTLTEAQKAAKERQELLDRLTATEERTRKANLKAEVEKVAGKLHFINSASAMRYVKEQTVEYDDDGEPKGVEQLLRGLAKDEPYLVRASGAPTNNAGNVSGSAGNGQPRTYTLKDLADRATWNANKDDIKKAQSEPGTPRLPH